jgi:hypothetical protein
MIEFGGVHYYIDLDAFDKTISSGNNPDEEVIITERKVIKDENDKVLGSEEKETISAKGKEIEGAKYDIIRMMIEVLIDYNEQPDDSLGVERGLQKTPLSYKVAFNTLYNCGILKEKE